MKIYFRLLAYCRPIGKHVIPYTLFTFIAVLFGALNFTMVIPLLKVLFDRTGSLVAEQPIKKEWSFNIIDSGIENFNYYFAQSVHNKYGSLVFVVSVIICSFLISNFFKYLSARVMESLKLQTIRNLRNALFNKIISLHIGFYSNHRKGDVMGRLTHDVAGVEGSITSTLAVFFKEPLTIIIYFVILFKISVELTIFALVVVPVAGLIISYIMKKLRKEAKSSSESLGKLLSILDESLTGLKVVKGFNAETITMDKFETENNRYTQLHRKMALRKELASPLSEFSGVLVTAFILLYSGSLILNNTSDLSAEEFITFLVIYSQVLRPAKAISSSFTGIQAGLASGERILEFIDTQPTITDKADAVVLDQFKKEVEFKNVNFAYNEHKMVLKDLNFTLEKGKMIALVGPSGGGKSTIADLISRFYDPIDGQILIDGKDMRDYTSGSIRSIMGIVTQESILFNETIFNNIAFGKPHATKEEVINAAKVANAHDFIMSAEHGYETVIGDRGIKLSGGQKQRLSIARAVLKNPPILILDEATSALDTESEKLVQQALDNLMQNRTSLVIAHRLSTIQKADQILVLQDGQIIERGNHQELLDMSKGVYKKLNLMQSA
ncbi:MAG: ABC transporter ATP-binding protein [Cytophagaceae bacterium]